MVNYLKQTYAPTDKASKAENKLFYDELKRTKYSHNYVILMGDFNAQVNVKQNKEENILGDYGQGKGSPYGEMLVGFLLELNTPQQAI